MRPRIACGFFCLFFIATTAATTVADIVWSGFAKEDRSNASGILSINVHNLHIASIDDPLTGIALENTTTGEVINFDLAGTLDGVVSSSASLFATGDANTYSSSDLGINWIDPISANNGNDNAQTFDGRNGQVEGLQFTFHNNTFLRSASFGGLDWAVNETTDALIYESVEVYHNGVLINTLLSKEADDVVAGSVRQEFTDQTNPIAAPENNDDVFQGLNLFFKDGDTLEFRMNGNQLTGAGASAGFRLTQITVVAIPEPSLTWLFAGAGFLICMRRCYSK